MTNCPARNQLYLVDLCRAPGKSVGRPLLDVRPHPMSRPRRVIYYSLAASAKAYAPRETAMSFFMEAVIAAFSEADSLTVPVFAESLPDRFTDHLNALSRVQGVKPYGEIEKSGDFPFHYPPGTSPPSPAPPPPTAKAKAPRKRTKEAKSDASTPSTEANSANAAADEAGKAAPAGLGRTAKIGDVFNHIFELTRLVGRGRVGEVFEGRNVNTDEQVTIRTILPPLATDKEFIGAFAREARILTKLDHEALVTPRVMAQEPSLKILYIVNDFYAGPTLAGWLGELNLRADDLAKLLRRLAEGLAAAHALGVVHRNLSPESIILPDANSARARITDFGITIDPELLPKLGDDFLSSKINYYPPEQLGQFDSNIGPWTDVYSLGLTILAVARHEGVDMSGSQSEAIAKRRRAPDLTALPTEMRPLIAAMLRFAPAERPQSMADVLKMLDETRAARAPEPNTRFVTDDPEVERDDLRRGPLAIALGRRLHRIWCRSNGIKVPGGEDVEAADDDRSAFVLHLDAPWGGGKTSFGNFLARVLNPFPRGTRDVADFLKERAGRAVGTIFIDDPPADRKEGGVAASWPEEARRPWIVVQFNAWQAEHCTPPWWTFYQAIRKGCFASVWAEGRGASRPAQSSPPPAPLIEERLWSWAALWLRELWWRLRNPKVVARLATFALAATALIVLWQFNLVFQGNGGPDFNAGNALGFVLAGIGGISGLWGLGALLTESVAPGTDDAAERRSLGGGDPFERFRRHFHGTIAAVRRPVMVIVDDLDRCRPDFVVDLVRGIQTLLRSPRVVFVILGDRDWIERAFEAHHAAMSKVNVGPEQEFGARFVEKAIQMSFILPEMPDKSQDDYVRRVLIGPGVVAAADAAPPAPPDIAQQFRADYREKVAGAETAEARKEAEKELVEQYRPQLEAAAKAEAAETAPAAGSAGPKPAEASAVAEAQTGKLASEERALSAAVDEKMGQALLHRLEPLAHFFPPNPRQIKRIVNAITMYTAVAYLQMEMDESDERGIELAIWVIIMTEWPKTWRVLASCPKLVDLLAEADAKAALDKIDESELPGSRAATLREVNRIRSDPDLLALITTAAEGRPRLSTSSVEDFVRLTPLYSRKQRLLEEGKSAKEKDGAES